MRLIYITSLILILISGTIVVAQNDCSSPTVITIPPASWPYQNLGQTTCGRGNDYEEATCLGLDDTGEDIVYRIDVTSTTYVNITFDPKGTFRSGIALSMTNCPGVGSDCLYTFITNGSAYTFYNVELDAGVTYYITIDNDISMGDDCISEFDLTISEGSEPTGRCCYGDEVSPSCADMETEATCMARADYISWEEGLNCTGDPCPVINDGDDCSNPLIIEIPPATWPYEDLSQTTCGRNNNYYGETCLGSIDSGEDLIYRIDVSENTSVNITFDPKNSYATGLSISENNCPGEGSDCLYTLYSNFGPVTLYNVSLSTGTNYYITIDSEESMTYCIPEFDLTISQGTAQTGRCCYGDMLSPSCADEETEATCEARTDYISWAQGVNCTNDPCPIINEGDNCSNPIVIAIPPASWPYEDLAQTTCGHANDYGTETCLMEYATSEDIIYLLDISENTSVNITFDPKDSYMTGLLISEDDCPGESPNCLYTITSVYEPVTLYNVELNAGTEYYIMIDNSDVMGSCISEFDLTISQGTEPIGRCCYGSNDYPECADEIQTVCEAHADYISWVQGESCSENSCPLSGGADCNNPISISPWHLPYIRHTETTCGFDNSYTETCLDNYDSSEDIVYEFDNDSESPITLTVSFSDFSNMQFGILIDDTCPPGGSGECLDFFQSTGSETEYTFNNVTVDAGDAIYIMVDGAWECSYFNLSITAEADTYEYLPGDANMASGTWPPIAIGGDVTYLVNYFRSITSACMLDGFYAAADANGSCSVTGADVTKLVSYFRGMDNLSYCPDYPTTWPPMPDTAPDGWPGCDSPILSK